MSSSLFASCLAQSTPNKLAKGNEQFTLRQVVNPGKLHSTKESAMASLDGKVPPNLEILKYSERRAGGENAMGWYVVEKTPIITGNDLQHVRAMPATFGGGYIVVFNLRPMAVEKFREWTKANSGAYLAIVLDEVVISALVVRGEIPDGYVTIEGNFTKEEAENLSVKLSGG